MMEFPGFSNPLTTLPPGDWIAISYIVLVMFLGGLILERHENRRIRAGIHHARKQSYVLAMAQLWAAMILVLAVWFSAGRGPVPLGLDTSIGWQTITILVLMAIAVLYFGGQIITILFSSAVRHEWQKAMAEFRRNVPLMPATRSDAAVFALLGITAGITEEIIFRFYLIGALSAAIPVWAAALVSLVIFLSLHSYQGFRGMIQVTIMGAIITALYVLHTPLWLLIVFHILVDLLSALLFAVVTETDLADEKTGMASG